MLYRATTEQIYLNRFCKTIHRFEWVSFETGKKQSFNIDIVAKGTLRRTANQKPGSHFNVHSNGRSHS